MMSRFGHWSAQYILDRLALMVFERRNPEAPWLTAGAIDFLDQWLQPDDRGLEWGSGRSTVWLASRVGQLHSIEDNVDWGEAVRKMLEEKGLSQKVDYHVIPVRPDEMFASAPYVAAAMAMPDESLDFCLVDGALRDHCAMYALDLLKPGGLLIIDNIERYIPKPVKTRSPNVRTRDEGCATNKWGQVATAIKGWRTYWTSNGIFDTAIWVKPAKR